MSFHPFTATHTRTPAQEYIETENARLDHDAQFWSKEIVVKIEYKFCPNLTIIDTPGLISAAPGKRNSALQSSARQVRAMDGWVGGWVDGWVGGVGG